jgi:hypothetical protein
MQDGQRYDSGVVQPLWGLEEPPADGELLDKFRGLAGRYLPQTRAVALEQAIWHIEQMPHVSALVALLAQP